MASSPLGAIERALGVRNPGQAFRELQRRPRITRPKTVAYPGCDSGRSLANRAPNRFVVTRNGREAIMASYKLVTYAGAEGPRAGIVIGEQVFDAAKSTGCATDQTVLGIRKIGRRRATGLPRRPPRPLRAGRSLGPDCWRRSGGHRQSIAPGRTTPTMPPKWRAPAAAPRSLTRIHSA